MVRFEIYFDIYLSWFRWYICESEETGAIKEFLASQKSFELIYALPKEIQIPKCRRRNLKANSGEI